MKCARLHLHERSKGRAGCSRRAADRPRRFCQRRLVDPQPAEDPRWAGLLDRYACPPHQTGSDRLNYNADEETVDRLDNTQADTHENLFLSVQNLKFDGDIEVRKIPKTCFKYTALTDGKKHRMFVKQIVEEEENNMDDCSSQLTCCHFDDYVKYILNNDPPDPASEKSSLLFFSHDSKSKENKEEHLEIRKPASDLRNGHINNQIIQNTFASRTKELKETAIEDQSDLTAENTKIIYHKSGKHKCLTISRAQSPETVQVIRVDVVRAHGPGARAAGMPDTGNHNNNTINNNNINTVNPKIINNINMRTSYFSNKYLLTNTIKPLDENVSGGAKVTLLCKTFRLSRRTTSKPLSKSSVLKKLNEEMS